MNLPRKVRKGENFLVMYDLWNGLVDYLASVRLVAGARITLQKLPSGTVIAAERQTSAPPAAGGGYDGPFRLTLEDGVLKCSGGWLNRNGISMDKVSEMVCTELADGTVAVRSELKDKVWSAPALVIVSAPDRWCFPVGELQKEDESFEVTQYPVSCAFIVASEICAMSRIAVE